MQTSNQDTDLGNNKATEQRNRPESFSHLDTLITPRYYFFLYYRKKIDVCRFRPCSQQFLNIGILCLVLYVFIKSPSIVDICLEIVSNGS